MYDEQVFLKGYDKQIRQIIITGHGKIKPAMIITNDFDLTNSILANNLHRLLALQLEEIQSFSRKKYPWLNVRHLRRHVPVYS